MTFGSKGYNPVCLLNAKVESGTCDMPTKTREDVVDNKFTHTTDIIKNAATKHGQFFAVPKVKEADITN
jgi:Asp-tRNA(Asn)/Glu-tRNA(Gln) amidotransferase C subunit